MNAQTTLSRGANNTNLGNTIGWGLALLFAVTMAWNITGLFLKVDIIFYEYFIFTQKIIGFVKMPII